MKSLLTMLLLTFLTICSLACLANVYVVIYATKNGKTGHAGIAIDNYLFQTRQSKTDTVKQGTLTYFDMWPAKDGFGMLNFSRNREAKFYKLPNSIWPSPITVASLYDNGLPHKEFYPSDAIVMIPTSYQSDYAIMKYLDSSIERNRLFNARFFNCSDFVYIALNTILGLKLRVKEFIPLSFTTTPNKLCKKLIQYGQAVVIKSPGNKIRGSFVREKILKRLKTKFLSADG